MRISVVSWLAAVVVVRGFRSEGPRIALNKKQRNALTFDGGEAMSTAGVAASSLGERRTVRTRLTEWCATRWIADQVARNRLSYDALQGVSVHEPDTCDVCNTVDDEEKSTTWNAAGGVLSSRPSFRSRVSTKARRVIGAVAPKSRCADVVSTRLAGVAWRGAATKTKGDVFRASVLELETVNLHRYVLTRGRYGSMRVRVTLSGADLDASSLWRDRVETLIRGVVSRHAPDYRLASHEGAITSRSSIEDGYLKVACNVTRANPREHLEVLVLAIPRLDASGRIWLDEPSVRLGFAGGVRGTLTYYSQVARASLGEVFAKRYLSFLELDTTQSFAVDRLQTTADGKLLVTLTSGTATAIEAATVDASSTSLYFPYPPVSTIMGPPLVEATPEGGSWAAPPSPWPQGEEHYSKGEPSTPKSKTTWGVLGNRVDIGRNAPWLVNPSNGAPKAVVFAMVNIHLVIGFLTLLLHSQSIATVIASANIEAITFLTQQSAVALSHAAHLAGAFADVASVHCLDLAGLATTSLKAGLASFPKILSSVTSHLLYRFDALVSLAVGVSHASLNLFERLKRKRTPVAATGAQEQQGRWRQ